MDSDSLKCNLIINNKLKNCEFCGKELEPEGLDYLYENFPKEDIKYKRCGCEKATEYWNRIDKEEYEKMKRKYFKETIDSIYKKSYTGKKYQEMNFEYLIIEKQNEESINIAKKYTDKNIKQIQDTGMIIIGESGTGKTYLAASIANKLIEAGQIVLMGRLTTLLDMIKETFKDNTKSENELIELYSNVDMIIIDDLGTERISLWALEKLYTIIQNRNENKLPIIITTRFNKQGLIDRFSQCNDIELANAVISKLYEMCYGITLKRKELV